MPSTTTDNLAVLVDADNAQASVIAELLAEVARYGTATVKRAYGDWTTSNLADWKDVLHVHAIQPIQQFRYTTGKNATDSALIIEAMDKPCPGSLVEAPVQAPLKPLLSSAISAAAQEDGWALLAIVGGLVLKNDPSFDPRNFGFKKLGELVKAQPYLEVKSTLTSEGSQHTHLFVRVKET